MGSSVCFLRLFDVEKYREIQSTTDGIINRTAQADDVISLLKAAKKVTESADFIMYNDPDQEENHHEDMQDRIDYIQKFGIIAWYESLDREGCSGGDVVTQLYSYICCPKYQRSAWIGCAISDMTVEYDNLWIAWRLADVRLPGILTHECLSVERLPKEINDGVDVLSIINRDHLPELAEIAEADVFDILHSNFDFYEDLVKDKNECLEIYKRINYLIGVANSQAKYTLFMDEDRY